MSGRFALSVDPNQWAAAWMEQKGTGRKFLSLVQLAHSFFPALGYQNFRLSGL
jgi:hypothetical protein